MQTTVATANCGTRRGLDAPWPVVLGERSSGVGIRPTVTRVGGEALVLNGCPGSKDVSRADKMWGGAMMMEVLGLQSIVTMRYLGKLAQRM